MNFKTKKLIKKTKSISRMFCNGLITTKSNKKTMVEVLKWVHIAISNANRKFLGIYHRINGEYLQSYFDEFVYTLNRRHFKSIFERLVVASVYPYWQTTE